MTEKQCRRVFSECASNLLKSRPPPHSISGLFDPGERLDHPTQELGVEMDQMRAPRPRVEARHVIRAVLEVVCETTKVHEALLLGRNRTQRVAAARQLALYLCGRLTTLSTTVLGRIFRRDHSTVIYAVQLIERRRRASAPFNQTVERLFGQVLKRLADAPSHRQKVAA